MKEIEIFKNGLTTGLFLQLAIGPVFFFIINLAMQRTILDGFTGVIAVTLADYIYIGLALFGISKVLEKVKKAFGIISSIVLVIFGIIIIKGIAYSPSSTATAASLLQSFTSVFFLTLSSPLTIVLFTGIFAAKAVEYRYTEKELFIFGFGTGLATFLFMGSSVILFSIVKTSIPLLIIQILNIVVGALLIGYGVVRMLKLLKNSA